MCLDISHKRAIYPGDFVQKPLVGRIRPTGRPLPWRAEQAELSAQGSTDKGVGMDQLVAMITEKTGLSADKAQEVIGMVIGFVSDKLPAPIANQVKGLIDGDGDGGGGGGGGAMDSVKKGLGGLLGG